MAVLNAADQVKIADNDPRILNIQALAAPLERGTVILGQLDKLDEPPDDPRSLQLLASAAIVTGAFDQALRQFEAASARLRDRADSARSPWS